MAQRILWRMPEPDISNQASIEPPPDPVAAEALDNVKFLARQRATLSRSDLLTEPYLRGFDERVAANVDVLVVRGGPEVERLRSLLPAAEGEIDAYSTARVLLCTGDPQAVGTVLAALENAKEPAPRAGLMRALRHVSSEAAVGPLQKLYATAPAGLAVAAAEVLAYHRKLDSRSARLTDLLKDADPLVRQAAWRAAALAG